MFGQRCEDISNWGIMLAQQERGDFFLAVPHIRPGQAVWQQAVTSKTTHLLFLFFMPCTFIHSHFFSGPDSTSSVKQTFMTQHYFQQGLAGRATRGELVG